MFNEYKNNDMSDSILRVDSLSHRYSVQWAVRDISFEIPRRGIYGLLGSNGAGKSTTMNIICGVLRPTEGEVWVKGIDMGRRPIEAKRHIGFLPQKPPLYEDLTVEEYLRHAADVRDMEARERGGAVDEVLEVCGLSHFRKRLLKNLSGGYQQRVGIAQAIIHKPELVVFDEPTNGLDPNQIVEIRHLIKSIAEERTVVLSTHILSEVQAACDAILMIEQGRLVFTGTVDDFDNYIVPNTLYVRFGSLPDVGDLTRLSGVGGVDDLGGGQYRLRFTDLQEVSDRVVDESSRRCWHLQEMRVEKSSLDMIFAELSRKSRK